MDICPVYRTWGAGVAEPAASPNPLRLSGPTIVRGVLMLPGPGTRSGLSDNPVMSRAVLLDAAGREVMNLVPGANDVRGIAPGVYFIREPSGFNRETPAADARKVLVTR
jgi:hypothetical protein